METNFASKLTVDLLARASGLRAYHFSRLFKGLVEFSPHQYLLRCRLRHAKPLRRRAFVGRRVGGMRFCRSGALGTAFPPRLRGEHLGVPRAPTIARIDKNVAQRSILVGGRSATLGVIVPPESSLITSPLRGSLSGAGCSLFRVITTPSGYRAWLRGHRQMLRRGAKQAAEQNFSCRKVRSRQTYAEITGGAIVLDIGPIVKVLLHTFT